MRGHQQQARLDPGVDLDQPGRVQENDDQITDPL